MVNTHLIRIEMGNQNIVHSCPTNVYYRHVANKIYNYTKIGLQYFYWPDRYEGHGSLILLPNWYSIKGSMERSCTETHKGDWIISIKMILYRSVNYYSSKHVRSARDLTTILKRNVTIINPILQKVFMYKKFST